MFTVGDLTRVRTGSQKNSAVIAFAQVRDETAFSVRFVDAEGNVYRDNFNVKADDTAYRRQSQAKAIALYSALAEHADKIKNFLPKGLIEGEDFSEIAFIDILQAAIKAKASIIVKSRASFAGMDITGYVPNSDFSNLSAEERADMVKIAQGEDKPVKSK